MNYSSARNGSDVNESIVPKRYKQYYYVKDIKKATYNVYRRLRNK